MGMKVCGQTLILVDNDGTVSEVNQKIIKSTLKYMFYHSPENRAYCLSTYGHELDEEEVYTGDMDDLLCTLDLLEFEEKDSNLTDVLASTITKWKEADFACRDIVVFTDGLEKEALSYEDEELYYLINNTDYPIYVVYLVQDNNASARKFLSAIATTSDGHLFPSEYQGSDAGVDRQLSEGIFAKMDEYAQREWAVYEEESYGLEAGGGEQEQKDNVDTNEYSSSNEIANEEGIIYEATPDTSPLESTGMLLIALAIVLLVILGGIVSSFCLMKKKKQRTIEDTNIKEMARRNTISGEEYDIDPFKEDDFLTNNYDDSGNSTRLLSDYYSNDYAATRLLTNENVHELNLYDINSPGKVYPLRIVTSLVLGRMQDMCDICLSDDSVSKKHCEFTYENSNYYVRDLGSANGTFVNNERIGECRLRSGDMLQIGQSTFKVIIE